MTATLAPFGLRPDRHSRGGTIRYEKVAGGIASGYAANLFTFAPLIMTTNGVYNIAAYNGNVSAVFAGVEFTDSTGKRRVLNYWPTGQVATDITCYVWRDPDIEYIAQANGSLALATSVGKTANFLNAGTNVQVGDGTTTYGLSTAALNATVLATGSAGVVRVLDVFDRPDNAWGDAFTIVRVVLNNVAAGIVPLGSSNSL